MSTYKATRPYSIWIIVALNFIVGAKLIWTGQFSPGVSFAILSGAILFSQNKLTWTISMAWALCAIAWFMSQLGVFSGNLPKDVVTPLLAILNLIFQIALTAYYFRSPYIQARWSPLGESVRVDAELEGELINNDKRVRVSVLNISNTGAAIRPPSGTDFTATSWVLSIPVIDDFKMSSRVVRGNENIFALQFHDLNFGSIKEHLKLLKWLRSKQTHLQSGFTLAEAMVVCAVSAIVVLGISDLVTFLTKANQASKLLYQVQYVRDDIVRDMRNAKAWQYTIADTNNSALECLRTGIQCTGKNLINLRTQFDSVSVYSLTPTAGYTLNGTRCNEFDATNGSDACPLRFTVSTSPVCPANSCENPVIALSLDIIYKPRTPLTTLNLARLATVVYREPLIDSIQKSCLSMNGTFDEITGNCSLELMSAACRTQGQYLSGLDPQGNPQCRDFTVAVTCPMGKFLKGFDATGGAVCAAL